MNIALFEGCAFSVQIDFFIGYGVVDSAKGPELQ
jgi:hypothetical protein